MNTQSSE